MHALVRFAHIVDGDTFTTRHLHAPTAAALDTTTEQYRLASLRYDLSKPRAKGLVERVPHSRRLSASSVRLLHLPALSEALRARLCTTDRGTLRPVTADAYLAEERRHRLDRLYQRIVTDLDALFEAVALKTAA